MRFSAQCKLLILLAILAPTMPACRSVRELWPLAQMEPASVRDPQASPPSGTNPFSLTRHQTSAADSEGMLPSLDAVDSMPVPTGIASAPPQAVYNQPITPPASQSLINALETEFATPAVDELADKPIAAVPLATQKTTTTREPLNGTTPPATAPAESAAVPAIRLVIAGVRPGYGDVKVAVFIDDSAFPEPAGAVQTLSLPPSHTTIEQALHLNSAFAVAVYQDINGDGELSRNRVGVPVEPFAFSNNAMGQRKPPSFEQAKVPLPNASAFPLTLTINLP